MSKLFDDSSLAMIPSAVKDGKLYSIRPTDGDGDFTFSRGSNLAATRVDVNGLIEKGRENLLLQSNQFDTTWATTRASVVSGQLGYDGTNNAWAFIDNTANNTHLINQGITIGAKVATFSIYAKAGSRNFIAIRFEGNTGTDYAYFNLSNGTLGSVNPDYIEARITAVGATGWYRCEVTRVLASSSNQVVILSADADSDPTYIGNSDTAIYIQDAQVELGLVATDYIETGASTAQAGILEDLPRLDYSGGASCPALLLEPQRINLIYHSEYLEGAPYKSRVIFTENAIVSPEGVQNASKIVPTSVSGTHALDYIPNVVVSDYTMSVYAKAGEYSKFLLLTNNRGSNEAIGFDLSDASTFVNDLGYATPSADAVSIEAVGNDWYRCSLKYAKDSTGTSGNGIYMTNDAGATTFVGNDSDGMYFWGWQMEQGSYPTSYIPTMGSAVTRSSDKPTSSSYNYQAEGILGANVGTIILDCETIGTSTGSNDFHMFGAVNSIADGYLLRANSGSTWDILERNGNSTSAQYTSIAQKQTRNKIGISYSGGDVDVYVNGIVKSVSSGTPVGGGNINGFSTSASNSAGLIIHQILLFPNKLTDTELASLTTI